MFKEDPIYNWVVDIFKCSWSKYINNKLLQIVDGFSSKTNLIKVLPFFSTKRLTAHLIYLQQLMKNVITTDDDTFVKYIEPFIM